MANGDLDAGRGEEGDERVFRSGWTGQNAKGVPGARSGARRGDDDPDRFFGQVVCELRKRGKDASVRCRFCFR